MDALHTPEMDTKSALVRDFCVSAVDAVDPEGQLLPRFIQELTAVGEDQQKLEDRNEWLRMIAQRVGVEALAPFVVELLVIAAEDAIQKDRLETITGIK